MACHNYNTIQIQDSEINVATIDTIMSFYLAFLYAGAIYYYKDRILCMAKFLFELQQTNKLAQKGVMKRFTPKCIGVQETMESIRAKKTSKFEELRGKKDSEEYEKFFLKYSPVDRAKEKTNESKTNESKPKRSKQTKKKSNKTTTEKKSDMLKPFGIKALF